MRIADVLRGKGGAVVTIKPDATVAELSPGSLTTTSVPWW